jgi:hypothetical protein
MRSWPPRSELLAAAFARKAPSNIGCAPSPSPSMANLSRAACLDVAWLLVVRTGG